MYKETKFRWIVWRKRNSKQYNTCVKQSIEFDYSKRYQLLKNSSNHIVFRSYFGMVVIKHILKRELSTCTLLAFYLYVLQSPHKRYRDRIIGRLRLRWEANASSCFCGVGASYKIFHVFFMTMKSWEKL